MRRIRILLVGLLGVSAAVFFGVTLVRAMWYDVQVEVPAPPRPAPAAIPIDPPSQLVIPALQIDADIEHIGLVASDRMAVPHSFKDAGWYKYGPVPGDEGTAIILGHLDNGLGLTGVFKRLHELVPGDEIEILTEGGRTVRFRVTSLADYPYKDVPPTALVSSDAKLILITCAGHWTYDKDQGMTYDHRLVVSARLMNTL
ncbi:class F sortase [Candidatus Kaiserbacteria bacterium]|nr:class F sortase [Candidatus Kaiserbacteria bacterium]